MILKILASLILITMAGTLVTCLDIAISHSPNVEIDLYINGELANGSGISKYQESTWMNFDNETIWSFHDKTYNKTTTNTTHRLNRTDPKGTQGI